MSELKPYAHRESSNAFLPRDILDPIGAPSQVHQGDLVVFARSAAAAARHLHRLDLLSSDNPRQLRIAHGNDVAAIMGTDYPGEHDVYCWVSHSPSDVVVRVEALGNVQRGRKVRVAGYLRERTYLPISETAAADPAPGVTGAMLAAAVEATQHRYVYINEDSLRAAIAAALAAGEHPYRYSAQLGTNPRGDRMWGIWDHVRCTWHSRDMWFLHPNRATVTANTLNIQAGTTGPAEEAKP